MIHWRATVQGKSGFEHYKLLFQHNYSHDLIGTAHTITNLIIFDDYGDASAAYSDVEDGSAATHVCESCGCVEEFLRQHN